MIDKEELEDFKLAIAKGIPHIDYDIHFTAHTVDHLIRLVSQLEPDKSSGYFVFLMDSSEYRKVNREQFRLFGQSTKATHLMDSTFSCDVHNHSYKLTIFDRSEMEGFGMKQKELSPQQVSREKRQIMYRKLSQGRQEDIQQFRAQLENADDRKIARVSKQVKVEREEEVSEIARRLSSGKGDSGEGDLHLARASTYYSESPLK